MGDAEAVGLELPALARLDGDPRLRELDAVVGEDEVGRDVAPRLDRRLEPLGLGAAEERVADAERNAAQRQAGRDAQDRLVGAGVELAADRLLDVGGADVEGLDRDLGRARDDERAREAAGAGVELRLGDERARGP